MAFVRVHGNQLAIVHGERIPEGGQVRQQVLFTIYSKAEARAVLSRDGRFPTIEGLMRYRYPHVRFDWDRIRDAVGQGMEHLPDEYPYRAATLLRGFRGTMCDFVRALEMADPQRLHSAAELVQANRHELEYLRGLIDWRLSVADKDENDWNRDNAFFWRHRLATTEVPPEAEERLAGLYERGELDAAEAVAGLLIDTFGLYPDGWNYLGLVALDRGRTEEAAQHFQRTAEEGRKLFPRRIAKKHYWSDHATRPYMRGLRNLVLALLRLGRNDDALALCDRLDDECGDDLATSAFRASIFLNTGRWEDARRHAERLVGIWPEQSLRVAFALFGLGRRDDALPWFIHGALNRPRTARLLLGMRTARPTSYTSARDYNGGVEDLENLRPFLLRHGRGLRRHFRAVLSLPVIDALVRERDDLEARHLRDREPDRAGFQRLRHIQGLDFARGTAAGLARVHA